MLGRDEQNRGAVSRLLTEVFNPRLNVLQGGHILTIKADDCAHGRPIVRRGDRPESILAGRVPRLQHYVPAGDLQRLAHEIHADGRMRLASPILLRIL